MIRGATIMFYTSILLLMFFCGIVDAATYEENIAQAMEYLDVQRGDTNSLLLTDAPYVKVDGVFALPYLRLAQEQTGCTVGKGNLLFFQRPQSHPLRLMLLKKGTDKSVVISRVKEEWVSEKVKLGPAAISSPGFWAEVKDLIAGKDMFALATIATVWAKDVPYDFLKSAELHNHLCPGVTSGYLIAHYILNHYPLKESERYVVVASPTWCKEDALQVILDCTPGKKGMVVKHLSKAQIDKISFANPAGIILVWNAKTKTGTGAALTFDMARLKALSPKGSPKAAMVLAAVDYLGKPDQFVATAAEFELDEGLFDRITQAGGNPYEQAGLVKK
jgi:formylmethanofuran dehydrogenase subunit E-like metal-binding protein